MCAVKSTRKLNIERLLTPIGIEFGPLPSPTRLIHYGPCWSINMERIVCDACSKFSPLIIMATDTTTYQHFWGMLLLRVSGSDPVDLKHVT